MSYTPGPWHVTDNKQTISNGTEGVALTLGILHSQGDWEANARLIAAAPDLLEACELLLNCMRLAGWEGDYAAEKGRAAIAKATQK